MKSKIELSKEKQDVIKGLIKEFFLEERDEEIGDLAAILLMEFILQEVGPVIYNQAIGDCIKSMTEKVDELYGLEI
ncbi:DUF2164 domain-containing protein [Vallitalea pronyensis]|uniref:DUF2164 domain-containing protein n=1 Tax=Vallitalea pronyensis TaxID=1348613 RepID=A0A8J8SHK6_9FIRM|nr:DUF2164 domain-containing protein [Vallitalea pronyensis]QUI23950.1 DUF2164 domain-containing protein [Vallitalea pronyensis]